MSILEELIAIDQEMDSLLSTPATPKQRARAGVDIHARLSKLKEKSPRDTLSPQEWELWKKVVRRLMEELFGLPAEGIEV